VRAIVERLRAMGPLSPDELVDTCLELIGPMRVKEQTRQAIVDRMRAEGPLDLESGDPAAERRVSRLFQLIVASREYQFA
jgi:hypothetical protein